MRIATFNLENLFRRARVLNLRDSDKTTKLLDKIRQLASLLDEPAYNAPIRAEVFDLSAELQEYISTSARILARRAVGARIDIQAAPVSASAGKPKAAAAGAGRSYSASRI